MKPFKPIKPREELKFSWPGLFITTAVCFSLFALFLRLIDGYSSHVGLFFKIAIVSLICWPISYALDTINNPTEKRKKHLQ